MQGSNKSKEQILVTGAAGFIGFHLTKRLLEEGYRVIGLDNLNDYYEVSLKEDRLKEIECISQDLDKQAFTFVRGDIQDAPLLESIFEEKCIDMVVNLAAQAGVRYSLVNPMAYVQSNIVGFANILELSKSYQVKHLIYASSSSVYGMQKKVPFSVEDPVDHPISLYAATKKSNELMAHTYSHLYGLPTTGLRFFTVYGDWGRPDMAYFSFARNIMEGKPIKVFNHGAMERDFTYIDDIIEGVLKVIQESDPKGYQLYNIGNNNPIVLMDFIQILEGELGTKAKKEYLDMQPGDVLRTYADIGPLESRYGFKPRIDLQTGLRHFVHWFKDYYGYK